VKSDDSVVAIIDPETLLRPISDELPAWVPQASTGDPAAQPLGGTGFRQYLTLRVGREMLAVPLERIHRLQTSVQLSPIPQRGTGFDGIADVGDGVVPVIDLRRTLAGEQDPAGGDILSPCLLAVIEGGMAGIIVNQVLRIESVPEDQIMPAEDSPALPISQILHLNGQLMSVLALDRLLPPL
jgi:chemotaxis signal transduction protein